MHEPTPGDRVDLIEYLLQGSQAIRDVMLVDELIDATGIDRRTLMYWRQRVRDQKEFRRNSQTVDALWTYLGRDFYQTLTSDIWQGVSGAKRLRVLLPPLQRRLFDWMTVIREEKRVPIEAHKTMPLRIWRSDFRDWIDTNFIEELAQHLQEKPESFLTNPLLQQVWTYVRNEVSWVTTGPQQLAAQVAERLQTLWRDHCNYAPLSLTNLSRAVAPAEPSPGCGPIHDHLDAASRSSTSAEDYFWPKLAVMAQHFELQGNTESRALQYIHTVVDDARDEVGQDSVPIQIVQRARTVAFLRNQFDSVAKLSETHEILDLARTYAAPNELEPNP